MRTIFLSIFLSSICATTIFAHSQSSKPEYCQSLSLNYLRRPIFPGKVGSPEFEYAFQKISGSDTDAPTIVVLPGGPGGTSISSWGRIADKVLMTARGASLLLIDPRGNGCNAYPNSILPDETINTENLAADVIAALKAAQIQDYVLFGHSYGSIWATVTAAKAEREYVPPRAVILSGVLGRSLISGKETFNDGMVLAWEHFKKTLSPIVSEQLHATTLPFGASSEQWASFLENGLVIGTLYKGGRAVNPLRDQLEALTGQDREALEKLRIAVLSTKVGGDSHSPFWRIYRSIMCREMTSDSNGPMSDKLINGKIVRSADPEFCRGFQFSAPFFAGDYQIRAPLFYFQGTDDANTPMWQAKYHYDSQRSGKKFFVASVGVAHALPLGALTDCKDLVWKAIFSAGDGLSQALKTCAVPTTMETSQTSQALDTYSVDLKFLSDRSVLKEGSQEQKNAYSKDIGNAQNYPTFAKEAYLNFGSRKVRVYLIAANHNGPDDLKFIEENLIRFSIDPLQARLFIEQGDPYGPDGAATQVIDLTQRKAPALIPAIERARENPISFLNPKFLAESPFTLTSRKWLSLRTPSTNFDLSGNYSASAVDFLSGNVSPEIAIRFLRLGLFYGILTLQEFKEFVSSAYGDKISHADLNQFRDCCGNISDWLHAAHESNQVRNLVRERYMRLTLFNEVQNGDVIITHPIHMHHILAPEIKP